MEYCLSFLYVAMDELGLIWCMDAFMERRHKDWKFWGAFLISALGSFCLFDFVVSGITVLHTLTAYAVFFIWAFLLFKATNITLLALLVLIYCVVYYFISFSVMGASSHLLGISVQTLRQTYFPFIASSIIKLPAVIVNLLYCQKDSSIKTGRFDTMDNSISYIFVSFGQFRCSSYIDFYEPEFS